MTTNTTELDDLDEILDWFYLGDEDRYTSEAWAKHKAEAKHQLTKLIAKRIVEARIEDAKYYLNSAAELSFKRTVGVSVIKDRLSTLERSKTDE